MFVMNRILADFSSLCDNSANPNIFLPVICICWSLEIGDLSVPYIVRVYWYQFTNSRVHASDVMFVCPNVALHT